MATIAENLQKLKNSTDAIKLAIIDKGGKITGGLSSYADAISKISINKEKKDVIFYDYDGAILHSYTKDEFLALISLPELPTQDGLICQEWNYNFEDAKEYVQEYGKLHIGATYITDDNKTRLYIKLLNSGLSIPLYINQSEDNGVTVEWGDGNSETISGTGNVTFNHIYNEAGSYIISLTVNSGTGTLGYDNDFYNVMGILYTIASGSLYKVEIGSNMSMGNRAFNYCCNLQNITIPNSVTSISMLAFSGCTSLISITIPNSVIIIEAEAFTECVSLQSVIIPNSITSIVGDTFISCYSLTSIIIPNSVTRIKSSVFEDCFLLTSITIPNSVTAINSNAFGGCTSLISITIPNSVTSISSGVFEACISLTSIIIPNSVTSIGNTFTNCCSMQYYDFTSHTSIPTLSNINAFKGISSGCEIRVPTTLYEEWKAATNWSNYADYIVSYD